MSNGQSSWKPSATSTPVRANLNQIRINNLCPIGETNQSDVSIHDFVNNYYFIRNQNKSNVKKKCDKKTAFIYFDGPPSSSSSSDEEDFISWKKERHELKINVVDIKRNVRSIENSVKTRALIKRKSLEENSILVWQNRLENKSDSKHFSWQTKKKCNENLSTGNNSQFKKIKCEAAEKKVKLLLKGKEKSCELASNKTNGDFVIEEVLSDQENCFAENRNIKKNGASVCTSEKNHKSCVSNSSSSIGKKSMSSKQASSAINKKSAPSKRKQFRSENLNNNVNIFNSSCNGDEKGISLQGKKHACERSKMENKPIAEKKMNTKMEETECIKSDDENLSHQLFSYSQEQELINSLDLNEMDAEGKQEELNLVEQRNSQLEMKSEVSKLSCRKANEKLLINEVEVVSNLTLSLDKKKIASFKENSANKSVKKLKNIRSYSVVETAVLKNKTEFGIVEKLTDNLVATDEKCNLKKIEDSCDSEGTVNSDVCKNKVQIKKRKIKNSIEIKKKIDNENPEPGEMSSKKKICFDKFPSKSIAGNNNFSNGESEKNNNGIADSENATDSLSHKVSVFKQLSSISLFEKFQLGCVVKECWSLKNFKCGILKLNANSHHSNKTMYKNSYLGGVVIKGSMKMKIGTKKLELKECDMAFVPPLTEWLISNVSDTEAIMYYWCGRL